VHGIVHSSIFSAYNLVPAHLLATRFLLKKIEKKTSDTLPWGRILRIASAIALVAYLVYRFDMGDTFSALRQATWGWVVLSALIGYGIMAFQSLRWRTLMGIHPQSPQNLGPYLAHTATGNAANLVLPSTIGGDVVRSVALGNRTGLMAESIGSVLLGRALGVLLLPPLALAAFAWVDMQPAMRT